MVRKNPELKTPTKILNADSKDSGATNGNFWKISVRKTI